MLVKYRGTTCTSESRIAIAYCVRVSDEIHMRFTPSVRSGGCESACMCASAPFHRCRRVRQGDACITAGPRVECAG